MSSADAVIVRLSGGKGSGTGDLLLGSGIKQFDDETSNVKEIWCGMTA